MAKTFEEWWEDNGAQVRNSKMQSIIYRCWHARDEEIAERDTCIAALTLNLQSVMKRSDTLTAERDAAAGKLERVKGLLADVLPRLAHKSGCLNFNPTEEWKEKGSINFDKCKCGIGDLYT